MFLFMVDYIDRALRNKTTNKEKKQIEQTRKLIKERKKDKYRDHYT